MANPAQVGTFDNWITDRLTFETAEPKTGNTGNFDRWLADRIPLTDYTAAATAATSNIPVMMATYRRRRG